MAKAPKNAPSDNEWDEVEDAPVVPAEETMDVVCVSHDRPHIEDGVALAHGEKASVRASVARKLLKSRHVIRAEDNEA